MGSVGKRAAGWAVRRSDLLLLIVTAAGLVAGGVASLAGAGEVADAAWLAAAACGLGYALWAAIDALRHGRGGDQQQQVRAPYRPSGGAVDNTPQHASHSVRRHAPGTGPEDGQPRDLWPPGLTEYAHRDEAGVVAGV